MPIDWDTVPDPAASGAEMLKLLRELFPLPRSLTGAGVRDTLTILRREVPLELIETPSGTTVFDWTVPREWTIRDAFVAGPDGRRVLDLADSTLHVLGYRRRSTRPSSSPSSASTSSSIPTTRSSSPTGRPTGRSAGASA